MDFDIPRSKVSQALLAPGLRLKRFPGCLASSHWYFHHLHMFHITTCLYRHGVADMAGVWKGRAAVCWISSVPDWWQRGWPRDRVGSMAEAELLSQLAVILKPRTPIKELFRSFPAPKGWGGNHLEPDLAACGVLKKNAALFVEYDGYWRHGEAAGIARDKKKNAALLGYAPAGSRIVRISHTRSKSKKSDEKVIWITINQWRAGDQESLWKVLRYILQQMLAELNDSLESQPAKRLQQKAAKESLKVPPQVRDFCYEAAASGRNTVEEISSFLTSNGFSSTGTSIKLVEQKLSFKPLSIERQLQPMLAWLLGLGLTRAESLKVIICCPQILRLNIAENLKPTCEWLLEFGLSRHQLAKAILRRPSILTCSLERKLKPTVRFLATLGLSTDKIAKAVVSYPQILGLSIQQNLKPTLRWFSSLGLERGHIAKIISYHPRIVGFSIQKKLGPTVQWFLDIGLSKSQMSKCVASFPQLIGLSAQGNLRGKVELLQRHFPSHVVVEMIATNPRILSYRHHRLEMRLDALVRLDLKEKVISTMSMPNDVFCERFLTRIGGNVQLALSTITTQPMSGQGSHQDLS